MNIAPAFARFLVRKNAQNGCRSFFAQYPVTSVTLFPVSPAKAGFGAGREKLALGGAVGGVVLPKGLMRRVRIGWK